MQDWNVIITARERGFNEVRRIFKELGPVARTGFYNVLVTRVADISGMMETISGYFQEHPEAAGRVARLVPMQHAFNFQVPEEFQEKAGEIVRQLAPEMAGKTFYVRMHRRGFKGKLSSYDVERSLAGMILEILAAKGLPAAIGFEDPDAVIAVETVGQRAGLSVFSRDQLQKYPFLQIE